MGVTCSNKKTCCNQRLVNDPVQSNNEEYTVPLRYKNIKLSISDGRKVHNRYVFVTKFIEP